MLKRLENWSVKRLPDAEHEAFTGSNDWPVTGDELLPTPIAFAHDVPFHGYSEAAHKRGG